MAELTPQDPVRHGVRVAGEEKPDSVDHARRLNAILRGKVNWNGVFTLADGGATTTVVQDERVTPDCEISLHPLTANAASILVKVFIPLVTLLEGTAYRADPVGQFTVQHPAVTDADFTYRYSIKG